MKQYIYIILISIIINAECFAATTDTITQYGITWTFSEQIEYGQFVNGDYWIVDPGSGVSIIGISPGYTSSPRGKNGSMINPSTEGQGYDSYSYNYNSVLNVGIGITPSTPLVLVGNKSLVSTISNATPAGNDSYVNTAAVLTCLASPPATGSFRPGISGTNKTLHNFNTLNLSLLRKLAVPSGQNTTASSLTSTAALLQRVWLDHSADGQTSRYMHQSSSGMDDNYYFTIPFSEAALMLHLNFTDEEKHDLLVNFIQLGIDLYSWVEAGGGGWGPDGGLGNGRKWPILFTGIMLDYSPMKNIGQISGDYLNSGTFNSDGSTTPPEGYVSFGEDGQTFYVNQYAVDITSNSNWISDSQRVNYRYVSFDIATNTFAIDTPPQEATIGPWNPDTRNELVADLAGNDVLCRPYTAAMTGMPEFGIKYGRFPRESDSTWTANYRSIGTGVRSISGMLIAAYIMNAKPLWNHNALFDYTDRYAAISTYGKPDPFGYVVEGESVFGEGTLWPGLIYNMWNTYRDTFRGTKYKNVKSITQETP